ncbi:CDGSH iron-sulfur domain-containing protein [Pseudomonas cuatrocienegasensis]|nr:CDGSH iron-sulfur domain-containing protein [Pseudomonas cuatrocienegasensis]
MQLILCRCGHSRQLPYCDGRHQSVAAKGWSLRRFLRG